MATTPIDRLFEPLVLPCGRTLPNRLAKVAMYEHAASFFGGPPNEHHIAMYSKWSKGGWGIIMTGNVQVSPSHLSLGRDMILPPKHSSGTKSVDISPKDLAPYRLLVSAIHGASTSRDARFDRPLAIIQLNHTGRQSPSFIGGRRFPEPSLAPSAIRLGSHTQEGIVARTVYKVLFQTPKAMTLTDIDDVVSSFVHGVRVSLEAGFDGVQLHASHGYLLSQFMSRKLNQRDDGYRDPLLLLKRIVLAVRDIVPSGFVLGVKLNAADYVASGITEEVALEQLRTISRWPGLDFIEISGGDYEHPDFLEEKFSGRQAFFSTFSRKAVETLSAPDSSRTNPTPLIMLTGGFRTVSQMTMALEQNHAQVLGVGRLSVLCPDLPHILSSQYKDGTDLHDIDLPTPPKLSAGPAWFPRLIGAGVNVAWYVVEMRRMSLGRPRPAGDRGSGGALWGMWAWFPDSKEYTVVMGTLFCVLSIVAVSVVSFFILLVL